MDKLNASQRLKVYEMLCSCHSLHAGNKFPYDKWTPTKIEKTMEAIELYPGDGIFQQQPAASTRGGGDDNSEQQILVIVS